MSALVLSAVVSGTLVSVVLTGGIWLLFRFYGQRFFRASTRYAVWLTGLIVTAALPVFFAAVSWKTTFDSAGDSLPLTVQLRLSGAAQAPPVPAPVVSARSTEPSRPLFAPITIPSGKWISWVLALWAAGSALMIARLAAGYLWLSQRKASAQQPPFSVLGSTWLRQCGTLRRAKVGLSDGIGIPMAAGPFDPRILIPSRLADVLSEDELEHVGLHEAAHFARWDDVGLLFQRLMQAVYFFNPAIHWAAAFLDVERELACDDIVVHVTRRPKPYACCLTRVAELANGLMVSPLAAPAIEGTSILERRVEMILDKNRHRSGAPSGSARLAVVAVLAVCGSGVLLTAPQVVSFAAMPPESTEVQEQGAGAGLRDRQQALPLRNTTPPSARLARAMESNAGGGQVPGGVVGGFAGGPSNVQSPAQAEAGNSFRLGLEAYQRKDIQAAITFFGRAAELDPNFTQAHINLAAAYAALIVPGREETSEYAARALRILEGVLQREPSNADAMAGLGLVHQARGEMRAARDQFLKAAAAGPSNPSVLYSVGALDWIIVYDKRQPPAPQEQSMLIDEGLAFLDRALALDPLYDDAMTYKNLLLREKARLAPSPDERALLIAQADEWFNTALRTRQQRASQPQSSRPVTNFTVAPVAPPPPPPPPPAARGGGGNGTANIVIDGFRDVRLPQRDQIAEIPVVSNTSSPATPGQVTPPVRIGGDVAQANLIYQVKPAYPQAAREARVQDYVMLQVIISREGTVQDLKVLRGHPMLNDAAVDAVRQWRYRPVTLNGQVVEAITTVTVNFSFQ